MNVEIRPQPTPEERQAIIAALDAVSTLPEAYESRWRASGLADLRDGAFAEEGGSDAGVVEP